MLPSLIKYPNCLKTTFGLMNFLDNSLRHPAVDVFAPEYTPIYAPFDIQLVLDHKNTAIGSRDLYFRANALDLLLCLAHIDSEKSPNRLVVGTSFAAGQLIAAVSTWPSIFTYNELVEEKLGERGFQHIHIEARRDPYRAKKLTRFDIQRVMDNKTLELNPNEYIDLNFEAIDV